MGLFSSVGGFVNDVLGGTSSAKKAQKYNLQSMAVQNAYEKEAAQNAHQWEIEDLKKAGLNPVISANSGAQADTSLGTGGTTSTNGNILDAMTMLASAKKAFKEAELADAEKQGVLVKNDLITPEASARIAKDNSQNILNLSSAKFQNERARGFTTSIGGSGGGFGGNFSTTK